MTMEERDREIAARLIREKFAALGIVAAIGAPTAGVDKYKRVTGDPQGADWPHVAFLVDFSRGDRRSFAVTWKMETGCAPWKSRAVRAAVNSSFGPYFTNKTRWVAEREVLRGGRGGRYFPEIEASAAAIACRIGEFSPDPAEIFATHCRDGFDARDKTFEDWAQDYGYNLDSREAEKLFNAYRDAWAEVCRVVSPADAEAFAELAARL